MHWRRVVALAVAGLGLAAAAQAGPWHALAPEGAGFQASLPGAPEYVESASRTPAGRVVEHRYRLEGPRASYWITWTDLPRLAEWFASPDGIYENVREDFLGRGAAREEAFREVELGGHSGRELRYVQPVAAAPAAGGGEADRGGAADAGARLAQGRLQAFLVGRRLFVFDAVAQGDAAHEDLERFFASLALEAPAPAGGAGAGARGGGAR